MAIYIDIKICREKGELRRVRISVYIYIYINKYYERKKGRNYISRQACFVNRFTLQGFNLKFKFKFKFKFNLKFNLNP